MIAGMVVGSVSSNDQAFFDLGVVVQTKVLGLGNTVVAAPAAESTASAAETAVDVVGSAGNGRLCIGLHYIKESIGVVTKIVVKEG